MKIWLFLLFFTSTFLFGVELALFGQRKLDQQLEATDLTAINIYEWVNEFYYLFVRFYSKRFFFLLHSCNRLM